MFPLALPITDATWSFLLVVSIILFVPMVLERLRVPSIVGLIVVGVVIGPHGTHLLDRDASFELLGKVGLYYIMFLASLEMNLTDVMRNRWQALGFGVVSFVLPFGLGCVVNRWGLGLSWATTFLVASMYAGHTLLTYPIVMRWGLSKHRAVGITVGGTILTNVLTLLVLAVVGGLSQPEVSDFNLIELLVKVCLTGAALLWIYPWVCRRFFRAHGDSIVQYLFVLLLVFLGAGVMEWVGMEGILGAFLVGLALNRAIPPAGPLMNHIVFVGNALFIPYFLLGVGMLINVQALVSDLSVLLIALIMLAVGTAGKVLSAWKTSQWLDMSAAEGRLMMGMSTARAAGTLAIALVGYNILLPDGARLLDDKVLNASMLLILGSCIVASVLTERAARHLVLSGEAQQESAGEERDTILVAFNNPNTVLPMVNMALMLRTPTPTASLTAVSVVLEDDAQQRAKAQKLLDYAAQTATQANVRMQTHCRWSVNAVTGIVHSAREHEASDILIGLHQMERIGERFYGKFTNDLITTARQQILIYKAMVPLFSIRRLHIVVPPKGEFDPGFRHWCRRMAVLAAQLGCRINLYSRADTLAAVSHVMKNEHKMEEIELHDYASWDDFLPLAQRLKPDHLVVFVFAHKGMPSYHRYIERIPEQMERYFSSRSSLLIVPARSETRVNITSDLRPDLSVCHQ